MEVITICFGQFGPYHHARVAALQEEAAKDKKTKSPKDEETRVVPIQIAAATSTYEWEAVQGTAGPKDQETKRPEDHATNAAASPTRAEGLKTLCEGVEEGASPFEVFLKARKLFREEKVNVAFLPSYSPARYFALFAAAKSLGIRTVMMNESHAGTEQATGWKRWIKRQIVKRFDAALVGGEPQKRHFASLGIPVKKIFTGYDAVDNALFAAKANEVRSMEHGAWSGEQEERAKNSWQSSVGSEQAKKPDIREAYGLPERYFLSLGRLVEKKNLATLVSAYAKFCDERREPESAEMALRQTSEESKKQRPVALVFVGSGELEGALREQARNLGLRVIDRTNWKTERNSHRLTRISTDGSDRLAADRTEGNAAGSVTRAGCGLSPETIGGEGAAAMETRDSLPVTRNEENLGTVFFYGFRQIEENPVFYALAEAFVLPSLKEEWGLVVNEAMAAGLPVIVSRTAGCAEDLVPEAPASRSSQLAVGSIQSGEGKKTDDCKLTTDDSLEERSNGFVFDPKSSDALSEALRRIAGQKTKRLKAESARQREAKPRANKETDGITEMGKRSREIVAKFSCENFARQALRAAEVACTRATTRK